MDQEAGAEGETVVMKKKGPRPEDARESPGDLSPACA